MEIRADPKRYGFSFDLAEAEKTFEADADHRRPAGYHRGLPRCLDILESYPRATFVVLDRADHGWPLETPDLLPALIDDWLARMALAERSA